MIISPTLAGHAPPDSAAWLSSSRLRAKWHQALAVKARAKETRPLWMRARGSRELAHWIPMNSGKSGGPPSDVREGNFIPNHTGLWTLELAVETAPGKAALVPGQAVQVIVEHPRFSSLRAYTIVPRVSGPVRDWPALLPEIKRMGFNAIWMLPISRMGASQSPYSTSDPMDMDPSHAGEGQGWADAEAFADACAQEDLALGVDLVFNHVAPDGVLAQTHPEWIGTAPGEADGLERAGWWEGTQHGRFFAWRDLVRLRLTGQAPADRADLMDYWTEYALRWTALAARSAMPMARFDNAHSTPEAMLTHILPRMRRDQPQLSILGEYFETQSGMTETWVWRHGIERLLATPWMDPYAPQQRRFLSFLDSSAETAGLRHFTPLCSHDSPSAAAIYGGPLPIAARYALSGFFGGGCTGITQGSEWSTPEKLKFIGPPATESYKRGKSQHDAFRQINGILETEGPLDGSPTYWIDGDHGAVVCGLRQGKNGTLLMAANLDTKTPHSLSLHEVPNGPWAEAYISGCQRDGGNLDLQPGGVGIWKL